MTSSWFAKSKGTSDARTRLDAIGQVHPILELDPDGTVLDANEAYLKAVGCGLDAVKGRRLATFASAPDGAGAFDALWSGLKTGQPQSLECAYRTEAGAELWLRTTFMPVPGRAGRIMALGVDVTDSRAGRADVEAKLNAIDRSQAVIEFATDGTILQANENFLNTMGYRLDEIRGQKHAMFVDEATRDSAAYREFWDSLRSGRYFQGEYRRIRKDGEGVWINATYNPIVDARGQVIKIVKFATDISKQKRQTVDYEGQINAIHRSEAVIEFNLDGTILTANENFLNTMGYTLEEIQGRHHAIFVDPSERDGPEYKAFWEELNTGRYHSAEFRRITKDGREVWIRATYNPIVRPSGKLVKVVKFATDVTQDVITRKRAEHVRGLLEETASGAEELSGSVREIAQSMDQSRTVTGEAVEDVARVDRTASRLTVAAQSMSGILEAINNIAEKINLLALNATIEAARAGEAGRGFAVVASEVKALARQTQTATEEVRSEITGMLSVSSDVTEALGGIRSRIENVQDLIDNNASAVEQQNIVTETMTSHMRQAVEEANNLSA